MLFNSITFVVFFLLVVGFYYLFKNWNARKSILLIASYLFYAAWNPPFVLLLWISTAIDWFAHHKIDQTNSKSKKRSLLLLSLTTNLGLLAYFKYGNFFLENFILLLKQLGIDYSPPPFDIILPVGISFYTFQTLSCTIDVYRGKLKPVKSLLDFSLYVTFFPQLVAGPIVRVNELTPQFIEPKKFNSQMFGWGMFLLTLGLFQKMVLADTLLAPISDKIFGFEGMANALDTWCAVLSFSGQIYFDFAGYSTCAIGTALCLGFSLPNNFLAPYAALGFSDFWKRWHITLSTWLRDYLYIPLGGNQKGMTRTLINLGITMFLGGLWHGAAWTFVIWGLLHGLYLGVERILVSIFKEKKWCENVFIKFILIVATFIAIAIAWVFFRAQNFGEAMKILTSMFTAFDFGAQLLDGNAILNALSLFTGLFITHLYFRNKTIEHFINQLPFAGVLIIWLFMSICIILTQGSTNAFLYFQF